MNLLILVDPLRVLQPNTKNSTLYFHFNMKKSGLKSYFFKKWVRGGFNTQPSDLTELSVLPFR